jgi:hypothetical protein
MTERRTIYRDADGVRRTLITDDASGDFTVQVEQEVGEILEGIQRKRDNLKSGPTDIKMLGSIPFAVVEDLRQRGIWDDGDAFKKWLNSWDARPFRVWEGRI